MLHGLTTDKNEYLGLYSTLAQRLTEYGVISVRFDFRGHGESSRSPEEFSVTSQVLDTLAVLRWFSATTKMRKVDLFGCSFGAPPCIFTSRIVPDLVDSICLLAPVLDYRKTFIEPKTEWARSFFGPQSIRECLEGARISMTDTFHVTPTLLLEMMVIDVEAQLRALQKNIVILHGARDDMVPVEISESIAERNRNVSLTVIPNMEHGFTDFGDETGNAAGTIANIEQIVAAIVGKAT